jgi:hypothetical protein
MMMLGGFMDTKRVIADIDMEISKLQQVRALLSNVTIKKGPGRPKSSDGKTAKPPIRKMSHKGRAAISVAMKARWAKKSATKSVTKKVATND